MWLTCWLHLKTRVLVQVLLYYFGLISKLLESSVAQIWYWRKKFRSRFWSRGCWSVCVTFTSSSLLFCCSWCLNKLFIVNHVVPSPTENNYFKYFYDAQVINNILYFGTSTVGSSDQFPAFDLVAKFQDWYDGFTESILV